jgi:hypothetical protein
LYNRKLKSGLDYNTLITDHSQFSARTTSDWDKYKDIPTDSPRYQTTLAAAAPYLLGTQKPVTQADTYYGPKAMKPAGSKASFDDGTGTEGPDGQLYFTDKYHPPGVPDLNGAATAAVDPAEAAQLAIDSEASKDKPGFPVYDPYNHVGRNADGSIAFLGGNPDDAAKNAKQDAADTAADPTHSLHLTVGAQPDTNPDRIAQWLKDHPDDIAHKTQSASNPVDTAGGGQSLTGIEQGLSNVKNSVEGLAAPFSQSARNDLAQGLLNRQSNDANYSGSLQYGLGKFGGEMLGTAPALMIPGAGELAEGALAGSRFAPAASFLGGTAGTNALTRGLSLATRGLAQGGEVGALTSAGNNNSLGQNVGLGAIGGAVATPLAEGASNYVSNLFSGGATKGVTPAVASLAQVAVDKYGIPLRVLQIKGANNVNRAAATADSELIGKDAGHAANNADQRTAFTTAVAKTFGSDADKLTPDVMDAAKDRIGGVMNDIGSRTNITNTPELLAKLHSITWNAAQVVPDAELKPLLNQIKNISDTFQPGIGHNSGEVLSGPSYQSLIAKGSPLDNATISKNSDIRQYAQQIRNALDDALEAEASPEDAAALKQARFQYKNLMTVKNLAAKANVEGEINPNLLNGAVNTNFKQRAFQGAGDLGELAQIGQTFMKEPPNSFTADRLSDRLKQWAPSLVGSAGIADSVLALSHPIPAAVAAGVAGGGAAIKGLAGAAKRMSNLSPDVRNRFLGNALNGTSKYYPTEAPVNAGTVAGSILTNNMFQPSPKQGTK